MYLCKNKLYFYFLHFVSFILFFIYKLPKELTNISLLGRKA